MLMLTLAIFYLTKFNIPRFMDLTFQVPMQYCSLQLQNFLSSLDTSSTGYHFCFGSASSFFLELFFCSSPVAYWSPTNLRGLSTWVSYLFAFSYCPWGPQGKNAEFGFCSLKCEQGPSIAFDWNISSLFQSLSFYPCNLLTEETSIFFFFSLCTL